MIASRVSSDSPGQAEISGDLTVHGQTRPLTVPVVVTGDGQSVVVTGTVAIDRSQWGVSWTKMGAALDNHVTVKATFTKR